MTWILAFIVFWLVCAVLAVGIDYAYFLATCPNLAAIEHERRSSFGGAALFSIVLGPLALVIIFFSSGFAQFGWRLK